MRVDDYSALLGRERTPIPAGTEVVAARVFTRDEGGERVFDGVCIECPLCGTYGWCAIRGSETGPGWEYTFHPTEENRITMSPSIACTTEGCSGHYWLTDGVLREA
jgi:hypothetical protein